MFQLAEVRGIIPANAEPILKSTPKKAKIYESSGHCTAGVIEGIHHFTG
jgi:hypothetical protein